MATYTGLFNDTAIVSDSIVTTDLTVTGTITTTGAILTNNQVLTLPTTADTLVGRITTDTLMNKSIDAGDNTITNLLDLNIGTNAAINVNKLANGTITNTEFEYLSTVGSALHGDADNATLTHKSLVAQSSLIVDNSDNSKYIQFNCAGNTTGTALIIDSQQSTTAVLYVPNITTGDSMTTAATAQTLTNKTLTSPVISTITNTGTLTLPTATDTLVARSTPDTLQNKTLYDSNTAISNSSDTTKKIVFSAGSATTGKTLTISSAIAANSTLTVTGSATVNQDVSTGGSPSFDSINLISDVNYTPTMTDGTNAFVLSTAYGVGIKIDTGVQYQYFIQLRLVWSSRTTSSGSTRISLPVAIATDTGNRRCSGMVAWCSDVQFTNQLSVYGNSSFAYFWLGDLSKTTSTTTATLSNGSFGATGEIIIYVAFVGVS